MRNLGKANCKVVQRRKASKKRGNKRATTRERASKADDLHRPFLNSGSQHEIVAGEERERERVQGRRTVKL